jgi:hypothetical protein
VKFAKIGECRTKMASMDGLLDRLLRFVNIFSMTIGAAYLLNDVSANCHAVNFFRGRKDRPNTLVDQNQGTRNTSHGSQI